MSREADLILALNDAGPRLDISETRAEELAIEMRQHRAAAEAARRMSAFNTEPADFRRALEDLARLRP